MCGCYRWKHLLLLELQGWNPDSGARHAFWCVAVVLGERTVLGLSFTINWTVCYFVCNLYFERNTLLCACVPDKVDIIFLLSSALVALDKLSTFTIVCLTTLLNRACINIKLLQRVWSAGRETMQERKTKREGIHFLEQAHEGYSWLWYYNTKSNISNVIILYLPHYCPYTRTQISHY